MVLYTLCKLASLGHPSLPLRIGRPLRWIRQRLLTTDEKRDAAHLASATDLHELEFRIRELDRPGRKRRGPYHHS